jgi:glycine/D-amino acid oxidase-like deaminating enzyme
VNFQTNTPVTSVSNTTESDGRWLATTDRGEIRAKKIVFSTNGYTSALLPEYVGKIIPTKAMCSHIAVPKQWTDARFRESYCINPGHGSDYLIARSDGSFIIGGAYSKFWKERNVLCHDRVDDDSLIEPGKHYFDDYMQKTFLGWEESGAFCHKLWTGSESFLRSVDIKFC